MVHIAGRKVTLAQCAEVGLALIPASLFAVVLFPFAAAAALGVSHRTADNRWAFARAWLYKRLSSD